MLIFLFAIPLCFITMKIIDVYNPNVKKMIPNTLQIIKNYTTRKLSNYFIEIHHTYYIVNYPFGLHWYKIIIPRSRGPCKITDIVDSQENSIYEKLIPFLGPSHDFHKTIITPKILGVDKLTIYYVSGETDTFESNNIIKMK